MTNYLDVEFIKNWMNKTEAENKAVDFFGKSFNCTEKRNRKSLRIIFPISVLLT